MEYIVGVALALFTCGAATWLGMDRDRVFYPAMAIVVGTYYVAFAVADGDRTVLLAESGVAAVFAVVAVVGFKRNLWLVVGALAGHGVMDVWHHLLIQNSGVPEAWPGFCMAFDVTAAVLVGGVLIVRAKGETRRLALGSQ
jgi:hypothetical protein